MTRDELRARAIEVTSQLTSYTASDIEESLLDGDELSVDFDLVHGFGLLAWAEAAQAATDGAMKQIASTEAARTSAETQRDVLREALIALVRACDEWSFSLATEPQTALRRARLVLVPPCQRCGAQPEIRQNGSEGFVDADYTIGCGACGIGSASDTLQGAIDEWNALQQKEG